MPFEIVAEAVIVTFVGGDGCPLGIVRTATKLLGLLVVGEQVEHVAATSYTNPVAGAVAVALMSVYVVIAVFEVLITANVPTLEQVPIIDLSVCVTPVTVPLHGARRTMLPFTPGVTLCVQFNLIPCAEAIPEKASSNAMEANIFFMATVAPVE